MTYTLPVSIATTEGERAFVGQHALAALTKPATLTLGDGVKAATYGSRAFQKRIPLRLYHGGVTVQQPNWS